MNQDHIRVEFNLIRIDFCFRHVIFVLFFSSELIISSTYRYDKYLCLCIVPTEYLMINTKQRETDEEANGCQCAMVGSWQRVDGEVTLRPRAREG